MIIILLWFWFVRVDVLCRRQHFLSHVGTFSWIEPILSIGQSSRTYHSASGRDWTSDTSIWSRVCCHWVRQAWQRLVWIYRVRLMPVYALEYMQWTAACFSMDIDRWLVLSLESIASTGANCQPLKRPSQLQQTKNFATSFQIFKKIRYDIAWESSASRRFSWNTMPYWSFWKRRQNLKLSSAANYRWRFKS